MMLVYVCGQKMLLLYIVVYKLMSSGVEQFNVVFENFRLNVKNCIYRALRIDDDVMCIEGIVRLIEQK